MTPGVCTNLVVVQACCNLQIIEKIQPFKHPPACAIVGANASSYNFIAMNTLIVGRETPMLRNGDPVKCSRGARNRSMEQWWCFQVVYYRVRVQQHGFEFRIERMQMIQQQHPNDRSCKRCELALVDADSVGLTDFSPTVWNNVRCTWRQFGHRYSHSISQAKRQLIRGSFHCSKATV